LQRILELFSVILHFSVEFIPHVWEVLLVAASDTQPEPTNMTTTTSKQAEYPTHSFSIGDQVTLCGYSDRVSYTVIAATRTTLTIQQNSRTLLNGFESDESDKLQFTPGGFSGHIEGEQRYEVQVNPNGLIVKAHLKRKPRKVWTEGAATDGGYAYVFKPDFRCGSSKVVEGQHDHYDFNF
jgi:hypothetical protein